MSDQIEELKKYVKKHPENQMAWYLLGHEYKEQGQKKKATYCFKKAGEIYEAYEKISLPTSQKKEISKLTKRDRLDSMKRLLWFGLRKRKTWVGLGVVVLILSLLTVDVLSPSIESDPNALPTARMQEIEEEVPSETPEQLALAEEEHTDEAKESIEAVYLQNWDDFNVIGQELLQIGEPSAKEKVFISPVARISDQWVSMKDQMDIIYSISSYDSDQSSFQWSIHHSPACDCEVTPYPNEDLVLTKWKQDMELLLIAKTAVQSFERLEGRLPESLTDLVQDYPNNWLSATSPELEEAYEIQMRSDQLDSSEKSFQEENSELKISNPISDETDSSSLNIQLTHDDDTLNAFPALEIIVDKSNHRLALVSGDVVLRNYPVGLGGERTPVGTYEISEKVVNPNGHADGDFGSRGMTLSDTLYAIHGTNEPESIEQDESLGCIRMLNEDIEELFSMVSLGTSVTIKEDGQLPQEIIRSETPFVLPSQKDETNPNKVYRWLN